MVTIPKRYRKKKISSALREQVWLHTFGKKFETKCYINWCLNKISIINFQCGHNIPESRGGKTELSNLRPICSRCNLSMANKYTIEEWSNSQEPPPKVGWRRFLCFL
jgi:5-methylcytosine-specific restriction endonuclease McrA